MAGWYEPERGLLVAKDLISSELDSDQLIYFHDQLHIYWQKLLDGYNFEWTFNELHEKHTELLNEMIKRKIKHIFPINNLDKVTITPIVPQKQNQTLVNLQETKKYSVEKKLIGKYIQVHKNGSDVKIFSEQKKDLTIDFKDILEPIKSISKSDFIIEGSILNDQISVWDVLYFDESLENYSLSKRIRILKEFNFNKNIKEVDKIIVEKKDLKKSIDKIIENSDSIGVIIRNLDDIYIKSKKFILKKSKNEIKY